MIHQNLWKNCCNYSNLAQSQMLLYKHQQHLVPDYCTIYEQNQVLHWNITTNKIYEKLARITQIWNSAKCYFKCISNIYGTWLLYQIWIKSYFYEISQQSHKIYDMAINTQIWRRAKFKFFTCISSPWCLIPIWIKSI